MLIRRIFLLFLALMSCEAFVEVEPPKNQISSSNVFSDDATAVAAMNGVYSEMVSSLGFAGGGRASVTVLAGLSGDDFVNTMASVEYQGFSNASISPNNSILSSFLWAEIYKYIYYCNSIIEGISVSSKLSQDTRNQLLGEAKFLRAFYYFYLVNLFGDVPLALSLDFNVNTSLKRESVDVVVNNIVSDLQEAKGLLAEQYPTEGERIRVNRYAASAFLARVYLYRGKWSDAAVEAGEVIAENKLYQLENDLNEVFLANSDEAIWQLKPVSTTRNTAEGNLFILFEVPLNGLYLSEKLVDSFSSQDERRTAWIGKYVNEENNEEYYYPFKYKINSGEVLKEYSMVLRLAEMYLIRSEAKINIGDIAGSIDDVDAIRVRAGLESIRDTNPTISVADLRLVIESERRLELFSEWGHRWFDLKRTPSIFTQGRTRADDVLSDAQGKDWQSTDVLYPIPLVQILNDPNMSNSQNPGY